MRAPDTPVVGLCRCGCGQATVLSPKTCRREGWVKGEPRLYVRGHNGRRPVEQRFWEKVEKTASCWLWTGAKTAGGYGTFNTGDGSYDYAHRVAYRLLCGPLDDTLVLDHLCRVRHCCNPAHLEQVPHGENVRRGASPYGPVRTMCKHGHDVSDPANVYTEPSGYKRCRTCAKRRPKARP